MKLPSSSRRDQRGSTLLMVLMLTLATFVVLSSTLDWTTTTTALSARNNEYYCTVSAAESATEKVIASIESDYQTGGDTPVQNALSDYRLMTPTATESPLLGKYTFNDGQGNAGRTYVEFRPPTKFRVLVSQYRGLYGYSSIYRLISNAKETGGRYGITAGVWQDVETATIPLFQFAIFYNLDLEINPGPNMTVTGPVHGNKNLYLSPGATLTFSNDVTGAGTIYNTRKPTDPSSSGSGTTVFKGEHDSGVSTLNLPIGTNSSGTNAYVGVRAVVEAPPVGESSTSAIGQQRLYNKADVIVTVTGTAATPVVLVTSGIVNNKATIISASAATTPATKWIDTTPANTLYNRREAKTVQRIEIDVGKLVAWNASTNNTLPVRGVTGGTKDVTIVYVDDQRTLGSSSEAGVLVKNGQLLPPQGLTIATPDPLYVAGHYNVKKTSAASATIGTLNTANTLPAAFMSDAITVLSGAWDTTDSTYGNRTFDNRLATDTTVNAAFLSGVVETVTGSYSGGVENYPRFLEDWNGDTLTYNGSMVVLFPSQYATGLWQGTGSTIGIYNPPVRNWAFDQNFRDPTKLPPGTPSVRVLIRGAWAMVKPNTTTIADDDAIAQ